MKSKTNESVTLTENVGAMVMTNAAAAEEMKLAGVFTATCMRVIPAQQIAAMICLEKMLANPDAEIMRELEAEMASFDREPVWEDTFDNSVMIPGKNDALDKYFAGSSYTAAFYMGVISSVSYSAISTADTMASHAGWTEAGATNAPTYSQGARPTCAWSAASAGSKALSASLTFTIGSSGTLKGAFITTVSTKDGTTGTLFSAGLFSAGDKTVAATDSLAVSYSIAA